MAKRNSGYDRKADDFYPTPSWVTETILPYIPNGIKRIWEPSAGKGAMLDVFSAANFGVLGTDLNECAEKHIAAKDFLAVDELPEWVEAIITNPPYDKAAKFIEKALNISEGRNVFIAFLLREDFDCAKGRRHLFGECADFYAKVVLTKRIKFFDGPSSPSENHSWYVWRTGVENIAPKIEYIY
jgi:hypothetical protein